MSDHVKYKATLIEDILRRMNLAQCMDSKFVKMLHPAEIERTKHRLIDSDIESLECYLAVLDQRLTLYMRRMANAHNQGVKMEVNFDHSTINFN